MLFDAEAYSALRRAIRAGQITAADGAARLGAIAGLAAERVAILPLLAEAFSLRDRFGSFDVFYAVVARQSNVPLVTNDIHLARACEGYVEAIVP